MIEDSEVEDCSGTELQREDCCLFASAQENDNSTVRQIYQLKVIHPSCVLGIYRCFMSHILDGFNNL